MRTTAWMLFTVVLLGHLSSGFIFAQYATSTPYGTHPACGYGPGLYRPQPYTLNSRFEYTPSPNVYYAPSGPNQMYWNQYYPDTNTYGPREPNPFNSQGQLSIPRAINHLYYTRVRPRIYR